MHYCVCFWEHQFDSVCTGIGCLSTCAFGKNVSHLQFILFLLSWRGFVTNHWTESKTAPEYDHFASGAIVYVRVYPSGVNHMKDQTMCGRLLLHMSRALTPKIVPAFRVIEEGDRHELRSHNVLRSAVRRPVARRFAHVGTAPVVSQGHDDWSARCAQKLHTPHMSPRVVFMGSVDSCVTHYIGSRLTSATV